MDAIKAKYKEDAVEAKTASTQFVSSSLARLENINIVMAAMVDFYC